TRNRASAPATVRRRARRPDAFGEEPRPSAPLVAERVSPADELLSTNLDDLSADGASDDAWLQNGWTPNPNHTFASFTVGKSNQAAHAAAISVASDPGRGYN